MVVRISDIGRVVTDAWYINGLNQTVPSQISHYAREIVRFEANETDKGIWPGRAAAGLLLL